MNLTGKRALITGGSEGIGYGVAKALLEEGAVVAINGRDQAKLEKAAAELDCLAIRGDVGIEAAAIAIVDTFVKEVGGIDVLINNAGYGIFRPLVELELAELAAQYRTNVFGAFLMAREAAKHFVKQESGHLVNISSTAGTKGFAGGTAYASSKFALRGMSECWRDELRRHNVRVIHVNPSEVQTPFAQKASGRERPYSDKKLRPDEIADAIVGALKIDDRGFIPEFSVFATNPF